MGGWKPISDFFFLKRQGRRVQRLLFGHHCLNRYFENDKSKTQWWDFLSNERCAAIIVVSGEGVGRALSDLLIRTALDSGM